MLGDTAAGGVDYLEDVDLVGPRADYWHQPERWPKTLALRQLDPCLKESVSELEARRLRRPDLPT
jgi:hypothetical protein